MGVLKNGRSGVRGVAARADVGVGVGVGANVRQWRCRLRRWRVECSRGRRRSGCCFSTAFGRQEADLEREKARFWSGSGYGGVNKGRRGREKDGWDKQNLFGEGGALPAWDGSWPPPWHDALEPWTSTSSSDGSTEQSKSLSNDESASMQSLLFELMAHGSSLSRVRAIIARHEMHLPTPVNDAANENVKGLSCKQLLMLVATCSRARDWELARLVHSIINERELPVLCKHYMWLARLRLNDDDRAYNNAGSTEKYKNRTHQISGSEHVIECMQWLRESNSTPSADACEFLAGLFFYHTEVIGLPKSMPSPSSPSSQRESDSHTLLLSIVSWLTNSTDVGRCLFWKMVDQWRERKEDTSTWEASLSEDQWKQVEEQIKGIDTDNADLSTNNNNVKGRSIEMDGDGLGVIEKAVESVRSPAKPGVDSRSSKSGRNSDKRRNDSKRTQYGPHTIEQSRMKQQLDIDRQQNKNTMPKANTTITATNKDVEIKILRNDDKTKKDESEKSKPISESTSGAHTKYTEGHEYDENAIISELNSFQLLDTIMEQSTPSSSTAPAHNLTNNDDAEDRFRVSHNDD